MKDDFDDMLDPNSDGFEIDEIMVDEKLDEVEVEEEQLPEKIRVLTRKQNLSRVFLNMGLFLFYQATLQKIGCPFRNSGKPPKLLPLRAGGINHSTWFPVIPAGRISNLTGRISTFFTLNHTRT